MEIVEGSNEDVVKMSRGGGRQAHGAGGPGSVACSEKPKEAVCCLFRQSLSGETEEPGNEGFTLIQQRLTSDVIRVKLRLAVWAGFEVKMSWFQKLSEDNGGRGLFQLVRPRRQAGGGPRGAPDSAFAGVDRQPHLPGSVGCCGKGVMNVFRLDEASNVVHVGQCVARPGVS